MEFNQYYNSTLSVEKQEEYAKYVKEAFDEIFPLIKAKFEDYEGITKDHLLISFTVSEMGIDGYVTQLDVEGIVVETTLDEELQKLSLVVPLGLPIPPSKVN